MSFIPDISLPDTLPNQLHQYRRSDRLNNLILGILQVYQRNLFDVLEQMNRINDVAQSNGFFLDRIGDRLGFKRPRIANPDLEFFGFEGTYDAGGRTLKQAPFKISDASVESQIPIPDLTFRCLLFARARKLHGDIGLECWNDCLGFIAGAGGSAEITQIQPFHVTITVHDLPSAMNEVIQVPNVYEKVLPIIPGIRYSWRQQNISIATQNQIQFSTSQPNSKLQNVAVTTQNEIQLSTLQPDSTTS